MTTADLMTATPDRDPTTYRIEFAEDVTESEARAAMQGMIGGEATNIRTAIVGVMTGWLTCEWAHIEALEGELDRDDRVAAYR